MNRYDAIVLLGFGGPTRREEIRPFLDRVLAGRKVPEARYEEVASHYEHLGGKSPFNELTARQAHALREELSSRGVDVPVEVAYLNAAPFIADVAREHAEQHREKLLGVILAAFQSPVSWEKYQRLANARYTLPFYEHPLFVAAYTQRVRDALHELGKNTFDEVELIFTAHSIPQSMANSCPYAQQFARSAELIAHAAQAKSWTIAYQSRSGSPADRWLEPDVRDVLARLPDRGTHEAVVAPIGFLCDHVEVLYDLDVDAANAASAAGVRMKRALALNDHPLFIKMLADLVEQCATLP